MSQRLCLLRPDDIGKNVIPQTRGIAGRTRITPPRERLDSRERTPLFRPGKIAEDPPPAVSRVFVHFLSKARQRTCNGIAGIRPGEIGEEKIPRLRLGCGNADRKSQSKYQNVQVPSHGLRISVYRHQSRRFARHFFHAHNRYTTEEAILFPVGRVAQMVRARDL